VGAFFQHRCSEKRLRRPRHQRHDLRSFAGVTGRSGDFGFDTELLARFCGKRPARVFARATLVAVDNLPAVQQLSREFMTRYALSGWNAVMPLSGLVASGRRRSVADDVSLFKAMGMGISDLALGVELLKRARERGAGRAIPQPKKTKPRLAGARAKNPV